ncbi:trypsin 3A1-like [Hyposmocoma kahamanoa]|uniref:trypsin 3A1-like n=1 Tax=Hyposmocoma kahamanoa TaxID=1477025 RepID=UPI000E6D85A5|nr:trypsin 3A1-like [Hyposmocoma kahamanoa]
MESRSLKNYTEVTKLVVHGVHVDIEQYPYTAQVIIEESSVCGGAIISNRVIVTAAHCLVDDNNKPLDPDLIEVYLGSEIAMQGAHYDVCKLFKHPKYENNTEQDYFWDIGLLLLSRHIKLSRRVEIATIAPTSKWRNVRNTMTIAGFGTTDNTEELTKTMKATRMKYVDSRICNLSQTGGKEMMPVPSHMFCMVGLTWTSDCRGDSGSPITWRSYIVGLVSLGRDSRDGSCGSEGIPSMYTDLTYFRLWLKHQVKELESTSTKECEIKIRTKIRLRASLSNC